MEFHERTDHTQRTRQAQPGDDGSGALESLRSDGMGLLDVADRAIRAALSENSLEFLNSVRQTGGQ